VFYLLLLHAVQDCCSWGLAREGWQEHGKRKDVGGGVVLDKTALHEKAFRRRERGALGSIIMASSGKEKEGGGELGSSFLSRMFVSFFIVL
jgi:hypothetical protein